MIMEESQNRDHYRKLKFQLLGWILFIVCALFYLVSSLKNRDVLAIIGSLAFLVACFVFLVPVVDDWKKYRRSREDS